MDITNLTSYAQLGGTVIIGLAAFFYMNRQGEAHAQMVKDFNETIKRINETTNKNSVEMAKRIEQFTQAINKNTDVTTQQGDIIKKLYDKLKTEWEKKRDIKNIINVDATKNS